MSAFAVGFGQMLAAPSVALYNVAVKSIKSHDLETSSVRSSGSLDLPRAQTMMTTGSPAPSRAPTSVPMEKTQSDHSSRSSGSSKGLKKTVGAKGLGRIVRTTLEGISLHE
jgi:hypothetical protein